MEKKKTKVGKAQAELELIEIPTIKVGDTEVIFNDVQKEIIRKKIKKFGVDSLEVKAEMMMIVDYNKRQDYFKNQREASEGKSKVVEPTEVKEGLFNVEAEAEPIPVQVEVTPNDVKEEQAIVESFGEPVGNEIGNLTKEEFGDMIPEPSQEEIMIDTIKSLNLPKPICFFDTETTGLDLQSDRVCSISITKVFPDGNMETKSTYVNPVINISEQATEIHGITNEMVVDKPKFVQIAKSMHNFMKDCYLAGYNSNFFDLPLLQEEFLRCGIDFPSNDIVCVDACAIFKNFEKRDLSSALRFYCGKEMENAHDASADTKATVEIFFAQLRHYGELRGKSIEEIALIGRSENSVDFQGKILKDADGDYVWNFGKPKGKKIKHEMGFGEWVLTNNFPLSFKKLVGDILTEIRSK